MTSFHIALLCITNSALPPEGGVKYAFSCWKMICSVTFWHFSLPSQYLMELKCSKVLEGAREEPWWKSTVGGVTATVLHICPGRESTFAQFPTLAGATFSQEISVRLKLVQDERT